MKSSNKHVRTVGTISSVDNKDDQFEIEMKNDSVLLFDKLANIMTILIDYGPSSNVAEQRRVNDKIAQEILGEQYEDFVVSYNQTFGKKWISYKNEAKVAKKIKKSEEPKKQVEPQIKILGTLVETVKKEDTEVKLEVKLDELVLTDSK